MTKRGDFMKAVITTEDGLYLTDNFEPEMFPDLITVVKNKKYTIDEPIQEFIDKLNKK